jgi:hypothetical protein
MRISSYINWSVDKELQLKRVSMDHCCSSGWQGKLKISPKTWQQLVRREAKNFSKNMGAMGEKGSWKILQKHAIMVRRKEEGRERLYMLYTNQCTTTIAHLQCRTVLIPLLKYEHKIIQLQKVLGMYIPRTWVLKPSNPTFFIHTNFEHGNQSQTGSNLNFYC